MGVDGDDVDTYYNKQVSKDKMSCINKNTSCQAGNIGQVWSWVHNLRMTWGLCPTRSWEKYIQQKQMSWRGEEYVQ